MEINTVLVFVKVTNNLCDEYSL